MLKNFLLLTTIILSSSLYSDTTTLKNGKVYHNAKVFHKGDTVIVSFECAKQIVFNKSEVFETVPKEPTRWKTQEECNQSEEEAKHAAEKRKQEEARRREEKRLREEQRRQELALKKQECEAKGDVWNGKDCQVAPNKKEAIGKTFKNSIGMEFALIPAGEFIMGCNEGVTHCDETEKPAHKVKITNSFYMGKYEVTQGQWRKVMGQNPSYFVGKNCDSPTGCDNHPVEMVSWNDVQEFIKKINSLAGNDHNHLVKYRLPTEAEWEYAARAGTMTNCYWGNEIDKNYLWYNENSDIKTHPVGQKKQNSFKLHDMAGNVWEWTNDLYDKNYYSRASNNDPIGSESGYLRVMRGGSMGTDALGCCSSNRRNDYSSVRDRFIGFRLILIPMPKSEVEAKPESNSRK